MPAFCETLGQEFELRSSRFHMFVQVTSTLETLSKAGIGAPAVRSSGIGCKVLPRRRISIAACLYRSSFGADVFVQIEFWLSRPDRVLALIICCSCLISLSPSQSLSIGWGFNFVLQCCSSNLNRISGYFLKKF